MSSLEAVHVFVHSPGIVGLSHMHNVRNGRQHICPLPPTPGSSLYLRVQDAERALRGNRIAVLVTASIHFINRQGMHIIKLVITVN